MFHLEENVGIFSSKSNETVISGSFISENAGTTWNFCSMRHFISRNTHLQFLPLSDVKGKLNNWCELLHCSVCFFTSDDLPYVLKHLCVDDYGNIAPAFGEVK